MSEHVPTVLAQRIVDHLMKQKVQSLQPDDEGSTSGNGCAYRGMYGAKCAVGILIDDDHYDSDCESAGMGAVEQWLSGNLNCTHTAALVNGLRKSGVDLEYAGVLQTLSALQRFHDVHYNPSVLQRYANDVTAQQEVQHMYDKLCSIKRSNALDGLDLSAWEPSVVAATKAI